MRKGGPIGLNEIMIVNPSAAGARECVFVEVAPRRVILLPTGLHRLPLIRRARNGCIYRAIGALGYGSDNGLHV